jgi:hypothetical protein
LNLGILENRSLVVMFLLFSSLMSTIIRPFPTAAMPSCSAAFLDFSSLGSFCAPSVYGACTAATHFLEQ